MNIGAHGRRFLHANLQSVKRLMWTIEWALCENDFAEAQQSNIVRQIFVV